MPIKTKAIWSNPQIDERHFESLQRLFGALDRNTVPLEVERIDWCAALKEAVAVDGDGNMYCGVASMQPTRPYLARVYHCDGCGRTLTTEDEQYNAEHKTCDPCADQMEAESEQASDEYNETVKHEFESSR